MPETTQSGIAVLGWRRRYLVVVFVGWLLVDMFDGPFIAEESREHWFEAGFVGLALFGYAAAAWRRPLDHGRRWVDWTTAAGFLILGTSSVLRATLLDAVAFNLTMVMLAFWTAATLLFVRRARAREQAVG